jgi:tetratricopeptide (TPR) repeat protein
VPSKIEKGDATMQELQSDTLYWSATAVSRTRAREKLVDLLDAVKETFWFAGEEMAFMISPDWERTDRLYFDINDGYEDMSFETEYLIDQVKNASTLRKYKSLYNLAIIHERRGEPEKAIGFLNAALEIRPNSSLAKLYLEELKKYVAELKVVKQQVGEE